MLELSLGVSPHVEANYLLRNDIASFPHFTHHEVRAGTNATDGNYAQHWTPAW